MKIRKTIVDMVERDIYFSKKLTENIQKYTIQNQAQYQRITESISLTNLSFNLNPYFQGIDIQVELIKSQFEGLKTAIKPSQEIFLNQVDLGHLSLLNKQFSELTRNINLISINKSPIDQEILDTLEKSFQIKLKEISVSRDKIELKKLTKTVGKANEIAKQIKGNEANIFYKVIKFISNIIKTHSSDLFKQVLIHLIINLIFSAETNQINLSKNETITITNNFKKEEKDINLLNSLVSNQNVNLRSRRNVNSKIIYTIPIGTEVRVLKEYKKWILLALITEDGDYLIGFSYKEYFD